MPQITPETIAAKLRSPNGNLSAVVLIDAQGSLAYRVNDSRTGVDIHGLLGLVIDQSDLSQGSTLLKAEPYETNEHFTILGANAGGFDHASGMRQAFRHKASKTNWTLNCRAYDDGFAFRYEIPAPTARDTARTVESERTTFTLPAQSQCWFMERNNAWKLKSAAGAWTRAPIDRMPTVSRQGPVQALPIIVELPRQGYLLLTEAALWNFSGLRLRAVGDDTFAADLADTKGFSIAGDIVSPWRWIGSVVDLNELVGSEMVPRLAPPAEPMRFTDRSYIRPGRVVWRWWSSGTGNPQQERAYVNYAAELGFEYTTVDDGWEHWPNNWAELASLCDYARSKHIGVFVWKHHDEVGNPADGFAHLRAFLDRVKTAGSSGCKIDNLNAENLDRIGFIEAGLKMGAERQLIISYHGVNKPTGENRTYPNALTREGIRGLELNKLPEGPITPAHDAALPFTRFVTGPGDFTPLTVTHGKLGATTLAHQAATWVAFTSPLQHLAEDPAKILNDPKMAGILRLLRECPTVWDESRALPGSAIGDLAVLARRKDDRWFIAGLNGSDARDYALDLTFLGDKPHHGWLISDAGSPQEFNSRTIDPGPPRQMQLHLAKGGGFVVAISPKN